MISETTLPSAKSVINDLITEEDVVVTTATPVNNTEANPMRPRFLKELIGRSREKEILSMLINSANTDKKRSVDHILFYGPPGLGKTTLANIVANEMGVNIKVTSGPAIEKQGDLVAMLTNLSDGDVLFIDEIHRLRKNIEEVLYPAMEDFRVDIIMGQGPGAQSVRFSLPKFTLIGATTRMGLLSSPFRDRFGALVHLDFFSDVELLELLVRLAKIDKMDHEAEALVEIAKRSRGTARIAIRLFKRVQDYMLTNADNKAMTLKMAQKTLDLLGIDSLGLDDLDRKILDLIISKFEGGPVGLKTISAALAEDDGTIEDVYEPYLMRAGLLKRTNRGRMVTSLGISHINSMKQS